MKRLFKTTCILLLTGAMAFNANAHEPKDAMYTFAPDKEVAKQDKKFASDLMEMTLFQVKLLELARTQGHSQQMKEYATRLLPDYLMLWYQIGSYAYMNNYMIDPEDNGEARADINEKIMKYQEKRVGMEWDSDVAETLNDENKDGLDMLEDAKDEIKDPTLEQIRMNAIAVLQSHRPLTDKMKEEMKKAFKN